MRLTPHGADLMPRLSAMLRSPAIHDVPEPVREMLDECRDVLRGLLIEANRVGQRDESIAITARRLVAETRGEANEWARDLADRLNQTESCRRCEGEGWHAKHRACGCNSHDAYVNGCNEKRKCRACGGTGRVMREEQSSTATPGVAEVSEQ